MRDDNECINALRAIIGEAVSSLLKSGEAPHRENIITMLQLMGAQSGSMSVKAICVKARELITGKIMY